MYQTKPRRRPNQIYVCYPEELLPDGVIFHVQNLVQVYLDVMSRRLLLEKQSVHFFKELFYCATSSA
jgi:hypothetical protein